MKSILALVILMTVTACAKPQYSAAPPEIKNPGISYDQLLHEYLQVAGTKKTIIRARKLMMDQIADNLVRVMNEKINQSALTDQSKKAYAASLINDAVSKFADRFEQEQQKLMPFEELEQKIISPIFKNHFSHQELAALIDFYKSPVGVKFVDSIETLMQEISVRTNQEYGHQMINMSRKIAEEEFGKIQWQLNELILK